MDWMNVRDLATISILPSMPFQLVCVASVQACDPCTPLGTASFLLSMSILTWCVPAFSEAGRT